MNPKTERFEMRLDPGTVEELERWRSNQPDLPSRAEAVRRLIETGLAPDKGSGVEISDGEKLILAMMCEVYDHLKIEGEIDQHFIRKVIHGGHHWALEWKSPGIFHGHRDNPAVVSEVARILSMWSLIERSFDKLPEKARERVVDETAVAGKDVRFRGFDGNYETEHLGVAQFLIKTMGRFQEFSDRDLNSHTPSVEAYLRMLTVFEPINKTLDVEIHLTPDQIIEILNARRRRN